MSEKYTHHVGRPLSEQAARNRAVQVAVLGSPETLRTLSALVSGMDESDLAQELSIDFAGVDQAPRSLQMAGLIRRERSDVWVSTLDAWVRLGRLLSSDVRIAGSERESQSVDVYAVRVGQDDLASAGSGTRCQASISKAMSAQVTVYGAEGCWKCNELARSTSHNVGIEFRPAWCA